MTTSSRKVIPMVVGAILTAIVVLNLCRPVQAQAFKRAKEGQLAPTFTLSTTEKTKLSLKDFSGKVVAVCFWKFSDKSISELEALRGVLNKYKDKDLEVLAIYIPESDEKVTSQEIENIKKLITDKALSYPILIDEGLKIFSKYGVITMPSLAVIDQGGKLVSIYSGFPKFGGEKQLTGKIENALGIKKKVVKKKAVKYQPKGRAGFHYKFGMNFFNLGFYDKAIEKIQNALKEDPDYPDAHVLLAKIYGLQGKKDQAVMEFLMAIAADEKSEKKDVNIHIEYGHFAVKNGIYDEAKTEFEAVKTMKPDSGAGDYGLGLLFMAQEKYEEAAKAFKSAIDLYTGKKSKGRSFQYAKKSKSGQEKQSGNRASVLWLSASSIEAW